MPREVRSTQATTVPSGWKIFGKVGVSVDRLGERPTKPGNSNLDMGPWFDVAKKRY